MLDERNKSFKQSLSVACSSISPCVSAFLPLFLAHPSHSRLISLLQFSFFLMKVKSEENVEEEGEEEKKSRYMEI